MAHFIRMHPCEADTWGPLSHGWDRKVGSRGQAHGTSPIPEALTVEHLGPSDELFLQGKPISAHLEGKVGGTEQGLAVGTV